MSSVERLAHTSQDIRSLSPSSPLRVRCVVRDVAMRCVCRDAVVFALWFAFACQSQSKSGFVALAWQVKRGKERSRLGASW